jgi:hypothetical protein
LVAASLAAVEADSPGNSSVDSPTASFHLVLRAVVERFLLSTLHWVPALDPTQVVLLTNGPNRRFLLQVTAQTVYMAGYLMKILSLFFQVD